MIECKTDNGHTSLKLEGSLEDLIADALIITHAIWHDLSENNPIIGSIFKDQFTECINDPDCHVFNLEADRTASGYVVDVAGEAAQAIQSILAKMGKEGEQNG